MVIQVQPTESVADVVQRLKSGSSKLLRKEFPKLEEFLWGESFWSDGYFAETVGKVNFEQIKSTSRRIKKVCQKKTKNHGL